MKCLKTVAAVFASCVILPLWAEEEPHAEAAKPEPPAYPIGLGAAVDYSYTAGGDVKFRGNKVGDSDAQMVSPTIFGEFPVNEKWYVPVGIASEHIFLDAVSGAPMPDQINVMRINAGVGYHLNDKWNLVVSAGPLFYNLERIDGQDLGFGGMIRAVYKASPDLTVVGGLAIAPDAEFPVFPAAGAIWKIQTNLTLNLIVPKPRVIYQVSDALRVYAGGEVRFAVFRTDGNIESQTHVAGFNNALGTYRDIHLGAGAEYKLVKNLFADLEAGYSVGREINYRRIDESVTFEPAPYVHVGLRYRF